MKRHSIRSLSFVAALLPGAWLLSTPVVRAADEPLALQVRGGMAAFDVATNLSAIAVHGKSTGLAGRARVRPVATGLVIEELEASVPVATINTGMSLRDSHMRKYVFTTAAGDMPDLQFTSESASCASAGAQSTCQVAGTLRVRGAAKPFAITLLVSRSGSGYHAVGDGTLKLSAYGIERPSQLGVTTGDDVTLHLDFTAVPAAASSRAGDRR